MSRGLRPVVALAAPDVAQGSRLAALVARGWRLAAYVAQGFSLAGASLAALLLLAALASAQAAVAPAAVTFKEAVDRAIAQNPTVQQAAAEILRAQGLLREATAPILPNVGGTAVTTTLNEGRSFGGTVATPQSQLVGALGVSQLLFGPFQWALRAQATDNVRVAELSAVETRRQVALAAADAYLAVIGRKRVLAAQVDARDVARAHYELARRQRELGAGSRLNELRAQQQLSSDEALVEQAGMQVTLAEEALGVLMALDGPATAADEPALDVPVDLGPAVSRLFEARPDVQVAVAREQAAARVVHDSWKEWLPSVNGLFQPQYTHPETLFQPTWSWRAQVAATIPIFDSGARRGRRIEREAGLEQAQSARVGLERQAWSDVRSARESVDHAARVLTSSQAAAQQAHDVVNIVNISFQAGASTNIEVIDAQRAARDADTAVAVAEDQLRQARLSLLLALGLFPG